MPAIAIVNCTGACTSTVRENAKGGAAIAGWPAGGTVAVGSLTDAGYTLTVRRRPPGHRRHRALGHQRHRRHRHRRRDHQGHRRHPADRVRPPPSPAFGAGTFNDTGFQVTFGGTLGLVNVELARA